jgi:sigma-B regulation protein RsbU (phosphoserine phosphatase)
MPSSEEQSQALHLEDLEDLYENAPCGYLSFDPAGRLIKANLTFCRWMGFDQKELLGRKLHDFLNVSGRIFYETHFAPLLRMQGFFNEVALDFVSKAGSKIAVLANATERKSESGELQFTRVTIFLATDRRRYERELVDARTAAKNAHREIAMLNADLESRIAEAVTERLRAEHGLVAEMEVSELREQFIAVLGHDLRNPLASVGGGLRLLAKESLSPRGEEIIRLLNDSVRRMSGLIDDVLDLARGRLGGGIGLNLSLAETLEHYLTQVVAELQIAHPSVTIETSFAIGEPILCDIGRLGQLASNLLGNAITHGISSEPIKLHAETSEGMFVLWIANQGPPIPEAAMARLFQPFFRGDVRDSQQGLGLGLHIASEIAKAHRGTLTVTSSAEETRFTLRMPAGAAPIPAG